MSKIRLFYLLNTPPMNQTYVYFQILFQERQYSHIGPNHLLSICARITTLLDKDLAPSVAGIFSLLGAGRQSVLRTNSNCHKPRSILDYCTRIHSMPLVDSTRKFTHNIGKFTITSLLLFFDKPKQISVIGEYIEFRFKSLFSINLQLKYYMAVNPLVPALENWRYQTNSTAKSSYNAAPSGICRPSTVSYLIGAANTS